MPIIVLENKKTTKKYVKQFSLYTAHKGWYMPVCLWALSDKECTSKYFMIGMSFIQLLIILATCH